LKQLTHIFSFLTLAVLLASYAPARKSVHLFTIPTQTIDLYKLLDDSSKSAIQAVRGFQISEQVTFKEYKEYLNSVKKDSTEKFYLSQLPDSSIGSAEVYEKYLRSSRYDNYPVLGISWENAMNYCKWKTLADNRDSIQFVYRLPNCSEWLAAYSYLSENEIENDFNKNYSDWLINSKDESIYDYLHEIAPKPFVYDWMYFHTSDAPLALKRKQVIGNSYLYQQESILFYSFNFYANEGYRQIGFRYVKETVSESPETYQNGRSIAKSLLEHWGVR
jgi:Sulfatase-modifying factor enzyme 1